MNQEEQNYLNLMKTIIEDGNERQDRTGVGTKSLFGTQLRFSLADDHVPCLTTKKMAVKACIEELLFFIRGETQTKRLEEKGVNIWKGNTSRAFLDSRGLIDYPEGEMGPMYGKLWRDWKSIDQLQNAVDLIKNDPNSRRIMVTAFDPALSKLSVLDCCHNYFQFYVANGKLSCLFFMRSCDLGIGFPFNLLSYSILTHLIARITGVLANEIIFTAGDAHIYNNIIPQIELQLTRIPFDFPHIRIDKTIASLFDIEQLSSNDILVENYVHHPQIKMKMAI